MKVVVAGLIAALTMVFVLGSNEAQEKGPKYKIAEVMKKAMKGGLCGKVASGKASDAEKAELVELFTALCQNTPPKGDAAAWKEKTSALVEAAKKADGAALKKLANCGACHKVHK